LNDALAEIGAPAFVPQTISKIGAFYLPSGLEVEDEVRLLMKRHKGGHRVRRTPHFCQPIDTGIRLDSNTCPGGPREVPYGEVNAYPGNTRFVSGNGWNSVG